LNSNWNLDDRLNVNGNNHGNNRNGYSFGIALVAKTSNMKTYNNLYSEIASFQNLFLAYNKARKGKTTRKYVIDFEKDLLNNLQQLRAELLDYSYRPKPLKTYIIRDPKTRRISKSHFRDRIVHHAICNIIEPIFDKSFIYDSYANRKGKGALKALQRLDQFKRKVSRNGKINGWFNNNQIKGYCLKADIKHYFEEVNHNILLNAVKKKIKCNKTIGLIKKILTNYARGGIHEKGMPLGNLTSQFFANIYLNELDKFVKHKIKAKYYLRYVDDFVILHNSKEQLITWKEEIDIFLKNELKLELHPDKSRIIPLSKPIPFVGFRIFNYFKLLKKFNRKNIQRKLKKLHDLFLEKELTYDKIYEILQGSFAYMKQANTYNLRKKIYFKIEKVFSKEVSSLEVNKTIKYFKKLSKN